LMLLIIIHETDERGRSRNRSSAYRLPSQINDRLDLVTGRWDLSPGRKEGKCHLSQGGWNFHLSRWFVRSRLSTRHLLPRMSSFRRASFDFQQSMGRWGSWCLHTWRCHHEFGTSEPGAAQTSSTTNIANKHDLHSRKGQKPRTSPYITLSLSNIDTPRTPPSRRLLPAASKSLHLKFSPSSALVRGMMGRAGSQDGGSPGTG
jgi:hypothetical protein